MTDSGVQMPSEEGARDVRRVPPRAVALSAAALAVPVAGALFFRESLAQYGVLLWLLPLLPAFLLAYHRGWRGVTVAMGAGMAALTLSEIVSSLRGQAGGPSDTVLLVLVASYVIVALGIGWLVEVLGDVTSLRRREERLRVLEKALETMQLGVSITDAKGKIVYANPADAEQHGYSVEELIGKDVGAYAPAGTRRPLTPEQLKQLRHRRRQGYNARRDGSVFPVQLHSDVVLDAKGEPIGVITSCEDITERRVAEQELQNAYDELRISHTNLKAAQLQLIEAEKLESVGRLAAGVAHEVKNPLMTILTGVQYLTRFVSLPDPAARQLLDDMRDAVQRADSVIRGLLDFSAPRALECAPQNVNDIVERSLPLIKHEADRAQVTITTELGPALPALSLDGFKIQQVLINLITNAIHATPPGGSVTVRTAVRRLSLVSGADRLPQAEQLQSPQRAVFIEVEDTGSGIPEEALNKVFDPFYTTKPTGKGTGLGLSVTRQIVEMHHGSIHLENRLGAGARATVVLRVESEEATDGQATHPGG